MIAALAHPFRRAFTFLEVMVVVVIVGILAAIVIPRFGGVTDDAKSSALQGALGGVRSSIASFRAKAVIAGTTTFPTAAQLATVGTVVQNEIPKNPYSGLATLQEVSAAAAAARTVSDPTQYGWNYWVDNAATPPQCVFYANSDSATTVSDGEGGYKGANEL
ncbi:MAG: prepilin-type N-terminal cleavage/methylation domain-containing protein [Phycisphaerae bacterium]|nr:prepilin-type N-terminal cleavage/methylation domain-containing protein [Phycisphaerae bacterium]